jgi:hypothetical protein
MPPNSSRHSRTSALVARTNKVDSNRRALLKFDFFNLANSQDDHGKIFSVLANLKSFVARYNGFAAHSLAPQTPEYTASYLTNI